MMVSIKMESKRLREVTAVILDAIRPLPLVRELTHGETVLVQAYILGIVLGATGMSMQTLDELSAVVEKGYKDFKAVEEAPE